jgi:hypothetical protein
MSFERKIAMFRFIIVLTLGFSIGYAFYNQNEVASAAKTGAHVLNNATEVAPKVLQQIKQDKKDLSK